MILRAPHQLKRMALMVPTFLGITALTFALSQWAPGDPLGAAHERAGASEHDRMQQRRRLGLDAPVLLQYGRWLSDVVRCDFGHSWADRRPVSDKLKDALPKTVLLSGLALVFGFALAVPLGVFLARRDTWLSRGVGAALTVVWSVPTFWVALLLLFALSSPRALDIFPLQGLGDGSLADLAWHLALPVTCLALPTVAVAARHLRAALVEVLAQDFILAARARGISEARLVWRHALRNALLPVLTLFGQQLPGVFGGSVVIERVFGIPGMGLLAFDAVGTRDSPTVMAVATVMAIVTMVSTMAIDLAYGWADPRLRGEAQGSP